MAKHETEAKQAGPREPHPLEKHAERDTAIGYLEIPCKGGPDSIFVRVEMPIAEALDRADRILGPDRRAIMMTQVHYRMEHSS
jgi:hypothetical protein